MAELEQYGTLFVRPMRPDDAVSLNLQLTQRIWLGSTGRPLDRSYGQMLMDAGPCWAVQRRDGSVIAACGFAMHWDSYATCWAMLAEGLGRDHLRLSRIVKAKMAASTIARIEALIRADHPAGAKWARLVGLQPSALLECAGPDGADYHLFVLVRRHLVASGSGVDKTNSEGEAAW